LTTIGIAAERQNNFVKSGTFTCKLVAAIASALTRPTLTRPSVGKLLDRA
jgi:hypothetical protein